MAYRRYRGRRRRGSGWGFVVGALATGALALGVSWYLHVPVPGWIGSRNAEAGTVPVAEPVLLPPPPAAVSVDTLMADGEQAFAQGRWRDAASAFGRAADAQPDLVDAHVRLTRALINQHRLTEAIQRGQRAVAVSNGRADARAALAVAYDWGGQPERAAQIALEATQSDRMSVPALAALAEAYGDQYLLREADDALRDALRIAPDDPEVLRVQGTLHEARADYALAVEFYSRAIAAAPRWSYLYVSLGHAFRAQQLNDEALAAFGRASELDPGDARAEGGRGMVLFAREEYEAAIDRFNRALVLDPEYATAHAQIAWIHYARREYDRAEPRFLLAIERDRDAGRLAQYRHALGWIYLSARRTADARDQFTKALELNPRLQGARDGLASIRQVTRSR